MAVRFFAFVAADSSFIDLYTCCLTNGSTFRSLNLYPVVNMHHVLQYWLIHGQIRHTVYQLYGGLWFVLIGQFSVFAWKRTYLRKCQKYVKMLWYYYSHAFYYMLMLIKVELWWLDCISFVLCAVNAKSHLVHYEIQGAKSLKYIRKLIDNWVYMNHVTR